MMKHDELFQQHHKKLYNFCLKLTKNQNMADDLFQDTWAKAIEKKAYYNGTSPYEPWLMSLCVNIYKDQYRRSLLSGKIFQFFSQTEDLEVAISRVADPTKSAEEKVIEEVQHIALKKALQMLHDKYRLPLILYYYNAYSYAQIAQVLDIKEGTVKSRISMAKEKLKERMVSLNE